jgi:hypothetical protein
MPVIIALSRYGFILNVELKKFLVKATISSQYPFKYASYIGVSYHPKGL